MARWLIQLKGDPIDLARASRHPNQTHAGSRSLDC